MAKYNLFISFDLNKAGKDYQGLSNKIKTLGPWARIQKSLWYVDTNLSMNEAFNALSPYLDDADSLVIISPEKTSGVRWQNVMCDGSFIKEHWDA